MTECKIHVKQGKLPAEARKNGVVIGNLPGRAPRPNSYIDRFGSDVTISFLRSVLVQNTSAVLQIDELPSIPFLVLRFDQAEFSQKLVIFPVRDDPCKHFLKQYAVLDVLAGGQPLYKEALS